MNVKYEEDSNEIEFSTHELLTPLDAPSTSSSAYGTPEPKLNLLDGMFFTYLPEKSTSNKIVALCMVCQPRHVEVKGYGNCSSNFLSHLKRRHGEDTVAEYRNYIKCKKSRCLKHVEDNVISSTLAGNVTEPPFSLMTARKTSNQNDQHQLNENIYKFFISTMISPSVVENPYFTKLLDMQLPIRREQITTQQNLEKRIKDGFNYYIADIKYKISEIENICTVLHMWEGEKENFLGLSAHWITQGMQRFSTPLALRSIKNRNYNSFSVSQVVREIHEDFNINVQKLVGSVIGKDSNFVRAFNAFGVQLTNILMKEELDLEDCISFDSDDLTFIDDIERKYSAITPLDANILPIQLKCCSNVLISAIADAINEELNYSNNTALSNIHASTINKCNILWQAAGIPKLCEIIENHINMKLKRPKYDNWTSLNSALQQILSIKDSSIALHKALNLQNPISESEFIYLHEYLTCTGPIVEALDIIQSKQNTFYGILMPCLYALKRNLLKVAEKTYFYYCKNLINSYTVHVTNAFNEFFDLSTEAAQIAAYAALSFPRFKNQWLVCVSPEQRNQILNNFKLVVSKEVNMKYAQTDANACGDGINQHNDFFNFAADFESENTKNTIDIPFRKAEAQVLQFFAEVSTDLPILYSYPEIKKVFLKYNTLLPSLVSGERLFHPSTMSDLQRNHKAFNELLEKRIILNADLSLNGPGN